MTENGRTVERERASLCILKIAVSTKQTDTKLGVAHPLKTTGLKKSTCMDKLLSETQTA